MRRVWTAETHLDFHQALPRMRDRIIQTTVIFCIFIMIFKNIFKLDNKSWLDATNTKTDIMMDIRVYTFADCKLIQSR